ncbi:hypothetical protein BDV93DRAFT_514851 [Ceratobasidium sp. AG-I]|nr:hypothetical protein BDV93DRAFT_514851 [Ceratobasidium sp. AG-I]
MDREPEDELQDEAQYEIESSNEHNRSLNQTLHTSYGHISSGSCTCDQQHTYCYSWEKAAAKGLPTPKVAARATPEGKKTDQDRTDGFGMKYPEMKTIMLSKKAIERCTFGTTKDVVRKLCGNPAPILRIPAHLSLSCSHTRTLEAVPGVFSHSFYKGQHIIMCNTPVNAHNSWHS